MDLKLRHDVDARRWSGVSRTVSNRLALMCEDSLGSIPRMPAITKPGRHGVELSPLPWYRCP